MFGEIVVNVVYSVILFNLEEKKILKKYKIFLIVLGDKKIFCKVKVGYLKRKNKVIVMLLKIVKFFFKKWWM